LTVGDTDPVATGALVSADIGGIVGATLIGTSVGCGTDTVGDEVASAGGSVGNGPDIGGIVGATLMGTSVGCGTDIVGDEVASAGGSVGNGPDIGGIVGAKTGTSVGTGFGGADATGALVSILSIVGFDVILSPAFVGLEVVDVGGTSVGSGVIFAIVGIGVYEEIHMN
jgi:hypothetical protein